MDISNSMSNLGAVLLFSKLNKIVFGYFDPENMLIVNENTFRVI